MAHKLLQDEVIESKVKKTRRLSIPKFNGKFGFSVFIGGQEVFLGVSVNPVEIESVIRRRVVPLKKATVRVLKFD